jgi:hypothetical protein
VDAVGRHARHRGPDADLVGDLDLVAVVGERLAAQRLADDLGDLAEALAARAHVEAERVVLVLRGAAAEPQMQWLLGEQAEHGDLTGEAQRLVPRGDEHAGPEGQLGEAGGEVRREQQRARGGEVVAEVVLDEPRRGVPELGVELHVAQHGPVELGVARARRVGRGRHEPELDPVVHSVRSCSVAVKWSSS